MNERDLEQQAVAELEAEGFVVQREVRSNTIGKRSIVVDLVAWAPGEGGELAPDVIAEVKRTDDVQTAAMMLPFYLPVVGAKRAFVFNGQWHLLAEDGESLTVVNCPKPSQSQRGARAPHKLVEQLIWKSLDRARGAGLHLEHALQALLDGAAANAPSPSFAEPQLLELIAQPQNGPVFAGALLEAVVGATGRSALSFITPAALRGPMVRLLAPEQNWTVMDPFCGYGTLLASVHHHLAEHGGGAKLIGGDVNEQAAANARKLLELAGVDATVKAGDSLQGMPATAVNAVIGNPPLNLRLADARPLSLGATTRDATLLIIDKTLAALTDGGRAVLIVAPGFLFAGGATERFRDDLACRARVVSIIEIAATVFPNTAIHPVLLVLEKAAPTDTLVARLEGDWEAQLADDGDFMNAFRDHFGARA